MTVQFYKDKSSLVTYFSFPDTKTRRNLQGYACVCENMYAIIQIAILFYYLHHVRPLWSWMANGYSSYFNHGNHGGSMECLTYYYFYRNWCIAFRQHLCNTCASYFASKSPHGHTQRPTPWVCPCSRWVCWQGLQISRESRARMIWPGTLQLLISRGISLDRPQDYIHVGLTMKKFYNWE